MDGGILVSFWDGPFSGAILVSGRVISPLVIFVGTSCADTSTASWNCVVNPREDS